MNVLLVRQGKKYGPEYVTSLINQLSETNKDIKVVTLTDQLDTPGETRPLLYGYEGWWAKLECVSPEASELRPVLYIDLDSHVLGDVSQYDMGDKFAMVEDFFNWGKYNSSVMWLPKDTSKSWNAFYKSPFKTIQTCAGWGDQKFFGDFVEHAWKTPESGIVSYKAHAKEQPTGNIVTFHGHPKQKDAKGWAKERWKKYAGT